MYVTLTASARCPNGMNNTEEKPLRRSTKALPEKDWSSLLGGENPFWRDQLMKMVSLADHTSIDIYAQRKRTKEHISYFQRWRLKRGWRRVLGPSSCSVRRDFKAGEKTQEDMNIAASLKAFWHPSDAGKWFFFSIKHHLGYFIILEILGYLTAFTYIPWK